MADLCMNINVDPQTGQLMSLSDPGLDMPLLSFRPGAEVEVNHQPLTSRLLEQNQSVDEHVSHLRLERQPTYKAGQRFNLHRYLLVGGRGHHTGPPNSVHIRYELHREPWRGDWTEGAMDQIWGEPMEAPFFLETLGVFTAANEFFGPSTRMRTLAIGGSGPREHVSYEDGPLAEVVPWLQSSFRTSFPGQITLPGAMYYDPADERWVWIIVRRPHTGGKVEFAEDGQRFRFCYFKNVAMHEAVMAPEVSIFWGRGLDQAEKVLADQFDAFREPPAWWFNTAWFWMHPIWQPGGSFEACERAVEILGDECGVRGYGIAGHDVPWAGRDIDPRSLRPSPVLGGDDGMKRLAGKIRERGGQSFVWFTRTGMQATGDMRDRWSVRGENGKPLRLRPNKAGTGVGVEILSNAEPGFRDYLFETIEHYVKLGVNGFFWDSGYQPMPPDFVDRPELNHPGEAMVAPMQFYEEVYRFGRSLSPDFFMWGEGITTEAVSNAFAVDNATHGLHSAHPLMHRIAHLGRRRLVWRSAWPWDLAGAFPFVSPESDINNAPTEAYYRKIAADPMNRWLCQTVQQRGCRQAVGVGNGVAVLGEFVVAGKGVSGAVDVPESLCRGSRLVSEVGGQTLQGQPQPDGAVRFEVPQGGAWRMA
jgi:hypothetical protein